MDRTASELRAGAAEALEDSYGALLALQRIELRLARTRVAFTESPADVGGEGPARAGGPLNYVIVELRGAQGQATTDQTITSLSHLIVELRAATARAATADAIASVRQAINVLRWLAGVGDTGALASGFVQARGHPPAH